jgi:hypothetical protein
MKWFNVDVGAEIYSVVWSCSLAINNIYPSPDIESRENTANFCFCELEFLHIKEVF